MCVCVSGCLCVCDVTDRYPAKTAGPIEMPFGMWGGVGHGDHVLDGDRDPHGKRQFFLGRVDFFRIE